MMFTTSTIREDVSGYRTEASQRVGNTMMAQNSMPSCHALPIFVSQHTDRQHIPFDTLYTPHSTVPSQLTTSPINMFTHNKPIVFPFLKLPIELGLEVYSFISPSTEYLGLYQPSTAKNPKAKYTVLERPALSIALLSTCRQIRSEATPHINIQMALIAETPMRFTVDITSAQWLCCTNFLGRECFGLTPGGLYVRPFPPARERPSALLPIYNTNARFAELVPLHINEGYTDHRGLIDVVAEMLVL
jgi:hypothetical protein